MSSPKYAPLLLSNTIGPASDGFVVAEWQDAGGPEGEKRLIAPLHLHRHDDEIWYVLEGELRVLVGDEEIAARVGSAVLAPRRTPHTYWNPGPGRARYLLVMTSNIFSLIREIHATEDRSPPKLRALFEKYDSELLG
ncbi:MAG TPA: cupin domain-containing protein [Bryobacteraceae bacterium]|nr:cupin domain-containing protein [Bryobacteraceae bacterium]